MNIQDDFSNWIKFIMTVLAICDVLNSDIWWFGVCSRLTILMHACILWFFLFCSYIKDYLLKYFGNNFALFSLLSPWYPYQLAVRKRGMDNNTQLYELDGTEALGSYLEIQTCSDNAPDLSKCSIQWYRVSSEGGKKELISGILLYFITSLDLW